MLCLFYVIPVYVIHVFPPPFHNETDPRHLEHVSDLEQSVCVCVHLRRFSDIPNLRGVMQVLRNVSPRGYDMP